MFLDDISKIPKEGRLLGIDLGNKTIGLALSDINQTVATAYSTLRRDKFSKDVLILQEIIAKEEVQALVIGLPLNMDGTEGKMCQSIRQFARNTLKEFEIPIFFQDERMSSNAVDRAMLEADLSRAKRKERKDELAAAYILQSALDRL
ncbi:MAG: Holliday junction resolvase RuvX [Alphaproteobacteria bacterium CG11_big_fil_rev_8_21_14_0_20_44_7]|nr:MAG: Holliday junction resolvase RuvX [Alphaproteobacteria bacterium CG11_big_fil_rev_8_21_14_0_20_44_7]